jgi:hypothetical protein
MKPSKALNCLLSETLIHERIHLTVLLEPALIKVKMIAQLRNGILSKVHKLIESIIIPLWVVTYRSGAPSLVASSQYISRVVIFEAFPYLFRQWCEQGIWLLLLLLLNDLSWHGVEVMIELRSWGGHLNQRLQLLLH